MLSPKQFPAAPKRQGPGPPASPRYQADTQRAWLYRAGAPAAAAAASSRCHRLGQTILRIPAPLLTTCRPQSLLPGNQYGQSQVQGERQWRRMWPFSPNADRGSRSRGNRGASRGQRGFAGNLSRHPLRYRKPHPPTKSPPPFQTDFRVWLPPFPHPRRRDPPVLAASSFRLPASQHAPRDPAPSQSS